MEEDGEHLAEELECAAARCDELCDFEESFDSIKRILVFLLVCVCLVLNETRVRVRPSEPRFVVVAVDVERLSVE